MLSLLLSAGGLGVLAWGLGAPGLLRTEPAQAGDTPRAQGLPGASLVEAGSSLHDLPGASLVLESGVSPIAVTPTMWPPWAEPKAAPTTPNPEPLKPMAAKQAPRNTTEQEWWKLGSGICNKADLLIAVTSTSFEGCQSSCLAESACTKISFSPAQLSCALFRGPADRCADRVPNEQFTSYYRTERTVETDVGAPTQAPAVPTTSPAEDPERLIPFPDSEGEQPEAKSKVDLKRLEKVKTPEKPKTLKKVEPSHPITEVKANSYDEQIGFLNHTLHLLEHRAETYDGAVTTLGYIYGNLTKDDRQVFSRFIDNETVLLEQNVRKAYDAWSNRLGGATTNKTKYVAPLEAYAKMIMQAAQTEDEKARSVLEADQEKLAALESNDSLAFEEAADAMKGFTQSHNQTMTELLALAERDGDEARAEIANEPSFLKNAKEDREKIKNGRPSNLVSKEQYIALAAKASQSLKAFFDPMKKFRSNHVAVLQGMQRRLSGIVQPNLERWAKLMKRSPESINDNVNANVAETLTDVSSLIKTIGSNFTTRLHSVATANNKTKEQVNADFHALIKSEAAAKKHLEDRVNYLIEHSDTAGAFVGKKVFSDWKQKLKALDKRWSDFTERNYAQEQMISKDLNASKTEANAVKLGDTLTQVTSSLAQSAKVAMNSTRQELKASYDAWRTNHKAVQEALERRLQGIRQDADLSDMKALIKNLEYSLLVTAVEKLYQGCYHWPGEVLETLEVYQSQAFTDCNDHCFKAGFKFKFFGFSCPRQSSYDRDPLVTCQCMEAPPNKKIADGNCMGSPELSMNIGQGSNDRVQGDNEHPCSGGKRHIFVADDSTKLGGYRRLALYRRRDR